MKMQADSVQVCKRCVMDSTITNLDLDHDGVCKHCREFDTNITTTWNKKQYNKEKLSEVIDNIKATNFGKRYDCIVGVSGGVDSSYALYLAVNMGLRPLAVHVDGGWNSELAVSNIENLVKKLGVDLYTYVIDWEDMAGLQRAFFRSSVVNYDIPQDNAFVAALFEVARKFGIKNFISGYNYATESTGGDYFGHTYTDLAYLENIYRQFGQKALVKYPKMNVVKKMLLGKLLGYRYLDILNFIDFDKSAAKELLIKELSWRDYGGKHYESKFTKIFQAHYLPTKFGLDKRKVHLTSLIHSGQISRGEALMVLKEPLYDEQELKNDLDYLLNKLSISHDEWDRIMSAPENKSDFKSDFKSLAYKTLMFLNSLRKKYA